MATSPVKSEQEHRYTSTGIKFWRNPNQMMSYRVAEHDTVISTHISPEGACNLKCPYCSVTHRKVHNRIDLDIVKGYVTDLMSRGLMAVILTGGGEPTIYPEFDDLVWWLKHECDLSVALITNGTQARRVDDERWRDFSWVRVSINIFDGWEGKIRIPLEKVGPDCVIGSSFVFTQCHQDPVKVDIDLLNRVAAVARNTGARYVRLLPNCLLPQTDLVSSHEALAALLEKVDDPIFFHQSKLHAAPNCDKCHQSYFRPYLSEVPYRGTDKPGSVYPCDSVVLNDELAKFSELYQLCAPQDVLGYLDGEIKQKFKATKDCSGCVFTENVNMLDDWKVRGLSKFAMFTRPLIHEEFV